MKQLNLIKGKSIPQLSQIIFCRKPVLTYQIRVDTIKMSGLADEVVEAPLIATMDFINSLNIDYVCHGSDWTEDMVEHYYGEMRRNNKLKIVPFTPGISTTQIIKEILSRPDLLEPKIS